MAYKYYLALTSQLPFCSIPMRLDTYSSCQFSCSFCFSRARGGAKLSQNNSQIHPESLRKRLVLALTGRARGSVDEFLEHRVPLQLGGMNDPFSPWERQRGTGLATLKILREFDYPTVISTKSDMLAEPDYASLLAGGNFYVRVSFTLAQMELAISLERGVSSSASRLRMVELLSNLGVPVSIRLQPIVYGHEGELARFLPYAVAAGAKHISAEYLKIPMESASHDAKILDAKLPHYRQMYMNLGATKVGREYVLPSHVKAPGLLEFRRQIHAAGLHFGFADNEFLHLNVFGSCCNGADLFLRSARYFKLNILGIMKRSLAISDRLTFRFDDDEWFPSRSIFSHLNSRSRGDATIGDTRERWRAILIAKWNSISRGGPASFWGVSLDGTDPDGNREFRYNSAFAEESKQPLNTPTLTP
jgi:DNA repair photolyase